MEALETEVSLFVARGRRIGREESKETKNFGNVKRGLVKREKERMARIILLLIAVRRNQHGD